VPDLEQRVRDLLAAEAERLPLHREMPPSLRIRARRRIAVNSVATGAVAVILAVGVFTGLKALGSSAPPIPGGSPTPSVVPTTPTPTTPSSTPSSSPSSSPSALAQPCTSAELRAVASLEGAAGSRLGTIDLSNLSGTTCTLTGTPVITLLDQNLQPITAGVDFTSTEPTWQVNASPQPPGWPVVTLAPGGVASVRTGWSNWCPDGRAAPLWRVAIPGSGEVDVNGIGSVSPPPCNGPGQPSTIQVGPFEPKPGS